MFFDIGVGEVLLIAALALLVFGPDRLPKVAADAARALRQVREMASAARRELSDAAGLQDDEVSGAVRTLRDLDPRRGLLGKDPVQPTTGSAPPTSAGPPPAADPPRGTPMRDRSERGAALGSDSASASHVAESAGAAGGTGGTGAAGETPDAHLRASPGGSGSSGSGTAPRNPAAASIEPDLADPDWT